MRMESHFLVPTILCKARTKVDVLTFRNIVLLVFVLINREAAPSFLLLPSVPLPFSTNAANDSATAVAVSLAGLG